MILFISGENEKRVLVNALCAVLVEDTGKDAATILKLLDRVETCISKQDQKQDKQDK